MGKRRQKFVPKENALFCLEFLQKLQQEGFKVPQAFLLDDCKYQI